MKKLAKISSAILRDGVIAPGLVAGEKSINATRFPGIELYLVDQGMIMTRDGVTVFTPHGNILSAQLENIDGEEKEAGNKRR